jgi:hypothetical protein
MTEEAVEQDRGCGADREMVVVAGAVDRLQQEVAASDQVGRESVTGPEQEKHGVG